MIDAIRSWVINICTVVIFITAIEIILPDNSIKKYGSYVLGLILIIVIINPFIKIAGGDININNYLEKVDNYFSSKDYEKNISKYKEKNVEKTIKRFKENLQLACEKKLKDKFNEDDFKVIIKASYIEKENKFSIDRVNVSVRDKGVFHIKPVVINEDDKEKNSEEEVKSEKGKKIKDALSSELDISPGVIWVYRK